MADVSIIVPVYNAENYLKRCIESIINQYYTDFELILINDGSSDSSGLICDEYKEKDNRIKVFHQANNGVSTARNVGIDYATGKYIMFADSDDWVEPDWCCDLVNAYENCRCCLAICGINYYKSDNMSYETNIFEAGCEMTRFKTKGFFQLERKFLLCYVWNKVYSASLIKNNNLRFHINIPWGEDNIFNLEYLRLTGEDIAILNKPLYNYVAEFNNQAKNNLCSRYDKNRFYYIRKTGGNPPHFNGEMKARFL